MQTNSTSRKRPAPGTSPPHQQMQQNDMFNNFNVNDASQLNDDQFLAWGSNSGMNANYQDPNNVYYPAVSGDMNDMGMQMGGDGQISNQLVRRNPNQQITQQFWNEYGGTGNSAMENFEEDDEDLEQRAAVAKREALSKRPPKQIPPFIQKLSSYLDREENTHLIRWSDDGNSFLVLDEDEFAKKLIPNLFKHNNYASFVRQLNMYGFHKKVGLSDNSMRASEQKMKTPSEYYNPYFKRNRPELLWLIQKPKNETSGTKKKKGKGGAEDQDSGDEDRKDYDQTVDNKSASHRTHETVPKDDYVALKREVEALQRSQKQITSMLTRLRDQNNQYIQQAGHLVANHERHESSINAILTFLATFYNRSLQGGDFGNPFGNAIPQNPPQGNVVEYEDSPTNAQAPTPRPPPRRPLALLPPPMSDTQQRASPVTGSSSNSPRPQSSQPPPSRQKQSAAAQNLAPSNNTNQGVSPSGASSTRSSPSPGVKDSPAATPNFVNQYPDATNSNNPIDQSTTAQSPPSNNTDMMNVIHNANASNSTSSTPKLDFNSALRHFENLDGNGPLTPEQRNNMISLMASNSGTAAPLTATADSSSSNNQLATNQQTPYADLTSGFATHRDQLDTLLRMQSEQDSKVQDLAGRLQPLSPSGSIPGLPDLSPTTSNSFANYYSSNPGDFDLNNFMNSDYFADFQNGDGGTGGAGLGDITFGTGGEGDGEADEGDEDGSLFGDGDGNDDTDANASNAYNTAGGGNGGKASGGRVVGSVGTSTAGANSPAATVEETADDVGEEEDGEETMHDRRKRRRTGQ